MDGGLDLAIRHELGFDIEDKVKNLILNKFHGELSVGSAVIVETENKKWPYLISAPTEFLKIYQIHSTHILLSEQFY